MKTNDSAPNRIIRILICCALAAAIVFCAFGCKNNTTLPSDRPDETPPEQTQPDTDTKPEYDILWDEWDGEKYVADFSDGLPSEWTAFASDKTTVSTENGNLTVSQSGAMSAQFAVYRINPDTAYSDFVLKAEIETVTANANDGFYGFLYHTRTNGNKISGYAATAKADGTVSQRALSTSRRFTDIKSTANGNEYDSHTLVLEVFAGAATLYLDGELCSTVDCTEAQDILGKTHLTGGVAFTLYNCTVKISELCIKGAEASEELDLGQPNTKVAPSGKYVSGVNAAVITEPATVQEDALESSSASATVFTLDGTETKKELDRYISALKCGYPIFRVETRAAARKLLSYLRYENNISDTAVLSSCETLLTYVKQSNVNIRGVYDVSDKNFGNTDELWEAIRVANTARSNALMFGGQSTNTENVRYAQARFKSVWVKANDGADAEKALAAGANAIVCESEKTAFDAINEFAKRGGSAATGLLAAHRGNSADNYENSVEAFAAAYEDGATHIELDLQVSKDGKIVIMHDDSLNRTTNGAGLISNLTWAQISGCKIIRNSAGTVLGSGTNIPCLEDVYEEFGGKDCVLIIEIKCEDTRLTSELARITREYNMEKNVVIISFYDGSIGKINQLESLARDFPSVASASLQTPSLSAPANSLLTLARNNSTFDYSTPTVSENVLKIYAARGYSPWVWTVNGKNAIQAAWKSGAVGVTTDRVKDAA